MVIHYPISLVGDSLMVPHNKVSSLLGRKVQISLLLTVIAILLWAHSVLFAEFEIGYLGLIGGLPITFFVALTFLGAASAILWTAKENHSRLLCLQLLLFISALWLTPVVTNGSPPFIGHAYRNLGMTDYVVSHGHFDSSKMAYQSWPGAFILSAIGVEIGGLNLESMLSIFPFLAQLLYLLPLYVFLKNTLGESRLNYCWAGGWLFYLASWGGQGYLSPQAMTFFLLLTLLAVVTTPSLWEKSTKSSTLLLIVVAIFATLVITHLLTALAALSILVALYLVRRNKRVGVVVVLCLVLLVSWQLTDGGNYGGYVPSQPFVAESTGLGILTLDPGVVVEREVTGHFSGSESHNAVAKARVVFSSIFALIGLAGAILLLVVRRNFRTAVPILAITVAPLVLLPLSANYGQELLNRLYLFALPGMAYFGATLLDVKGKIPLIAFCLLLAIGGPLHIVSHYGNQEVDYFPEGIVSGLHFFDHKTTDGYVSGGWPVGRTKNVDHYWYIPWWQLKWVNSLPLVDQPIGQELPHYIAISRQERASYEFLEGDVTFVEQTEEALDNAGNCALIYDNPDFTLRICENR